MMVRSIIFISVIFVAGCGVTQPIRPIEEGKTVAMASFGGPIIPLGNIAIPLPYLNAGVQYGYTSTTTVYGNVHATALLFKDVGLDAGLCTLVLPEKGIRPAMTANLRGYLFWDAFRGKTVRFFPMGTITGSYRLGERSLAYGGLDALLQISPSSTFLSPFVGYSFPAGETVRLQMETKWLAMNKVTEHGVFEGAASISGKGNVGIYLGAEVAWE